MKMSHTDWSFQIELHTSDGTPLGRHVVEVDWEPAIEDVQMQKWRAGELRHVPRSGFQREPIWDLAKGEPYLASVHVTHGGHNVEVPQRYFDSAARRVSFALVEQGLLRKDDAFVYQPVAFRADPPQPVAQPRRIFRVEELPPPLPHFVESDLTVLEARSFPSGEMAPDDLPVFIPQRVIDEADAQTRAAGAVETAGILLGHLHRDPATGALAAIVSAQIPAVGTHGASMKVTFTSETWVAMQTAIEQRGLGESAIGWWHSHPAASAWCVRCPPESQRACPYQRPFMSEDDRLLHRAVFVRAHCVALVVVDAVDGLRHGLFGWRKGLVQARGFHLPDANYATEGALISTTDTDAHAALLP